MTDLVAPVHVLKDGTTVIALDATGSGTTMFLSDADGKLRMAFDASDGRITLFRAGDPFKPALNIAIHLRADENSLVFQVEGKRRVLVDGNNANVFLGGNGQAGDVVLWRHEGDGATVAEATADLDGQNGNLRLGGPRVDGNLALFRSDVSAADSGNFDKATIHLNGSTGDIILSNGDCAEDFDVDGDAIDPGAVLVASDDGKLRESTRAYDTRVAGVACGAGACHPGIILGRTNSPGRRLPIALVGKVYCKVDAHGSPVEAGDLLTTSATRGHAMRAADRSKAFGAVIGKALMPLPEGTGLIPILVVLQ